MVIRWTVGARRWWSWSLTGGVRREGEIVAFPFSFRQHLIRHHRRLWRRGESRSPHCHRGRSSLREREVVGALSLYVAFSCLNAVISSESEFAFKDDEVNSKSKIFENRSPDSLENYDDDFPKKKKSEVNLFT